MVALALSVVALGIAYGLLLEAERATSAVDAAVALALSAVLFVGCTVTAATILWCVVPRLRREGRGRSRRGGRSDVSPS